MMKGTKADIIARLKREILPLESIKRTSHKTVTDNGLGSVTYAFPDDTFPVGAIHEFIMSGPESTSATGGFVSGMLSSLMQHESATIWISAYPTIFPPALSSFGLQPDKIIFINLKKEKDILWAMEEALKCKGLAAVIAEVRDLSFTASRRLQLAVEKSQVTGFVLRKDPGNLNTTACNTRWKITSLPSQPADNMPGVGFPCWNIELLKVRNGSPGTWQLEFAAGRFRPLSRVATFVPELKMKTG